MCLVPLMHQILWLTSETYMEAALFYLSATGFLHGSVTHRNQLPVVHVTGITLDINIPYFTYCVNIP